MLALGRVYEIAARHPILSYHVSFAINWRFPPAGYPPPKTLAAVGHKHWPTLGQEKEKRTSWPANQRNWVEQSGKSHYKAVIVTPDKAFKNPDGAPRVGTSAHLGDCRDGSAGDSKVVRLAIPTPS